MDIFLILVIFIRFFDNCCTVELQDSHLTFHFHHRGLHDPCFSHTHPSADFLAPWREFLRTPHHVWRQAVCQASTLPDTVFPKVQPTTAPEQATTTGTAHCSTPRSLQAMRPLPQDHTQTETVILRQTYLNPSLLTHSHFPEEARKE